MSLIDLKTAIETIRFDADRVPDDLSGNLAAAYRNGMFAAIDSITRSPTVDAMEVVRCGNCKHFRMVGGPSGGESAWGNCQKRACVLIYADDFCSYGEEDHHGT